MKKNLITITRHPSVSCYVEEGTRKGSLGDFVGDLLGGGERARRLYILGQAEFYVRFGEKPEEERELWVTRLQRIRDFARENLA